MTMNLHGTVAIHASAKLSFSSARARNIKHRMELAPPRVFFQKLLMAGPMPIMILLKGKVFLSDSCEIGIYLPPLPMFPPCDSVSFVLQFLPWVTMGSAICALQQRSKLSFGLRNMTPRRDVAEHK